MSIFFLCHNPQAVPLENKAGYIYHYSKPRFFAHILRVDVVTRPLKHFHYAGSNKMFVYKRGDGLEQLFIIMIDQNLDRATVKLPPALKVAVIWYTSNLNKDDIKTYGKPSQVSLLSDLNVLTPGLQVVHLEKMDKFVLSYPDGVKTFDDSASMDAFTNQTLGYSHVQLEDGYFNSL